MKIERCVDGKLANQTRYVISISHRKRNTKLDMYNIDVIIHCHIPKLAKSHNIVSVCEVALPLHAKGYISMGNPSPKQDTS